jgi:hypothetical protein
MAQPVPFGVLHLHAGDRLVDEGDTFVVLNVQSQYDTQTGLYSLSVEYKLDTVTKGKKPEDDEFPPPLD